MNIFSKAKQESVCWLLLLSLLAASHNGICQHRNFESDGVNITIAPSLSLRSTLMNVFNFNFIRRNAYIAYNYERSYQIMEIGPRISVGNLYSLSFTPYARYGYLYTFFEDGRFYEKKGLSLDCEFALSRKINKQRRRFVPNNIMAGFGIQNVGRKYISQVSGTSRIIQLENNTLNGGFGYASKSNRFLYDISVSYLYDGILNNRDDKFLCYAFTFRYNLLQFPLLKSSSPANK